jgi:flagellar protein FlaG
MKVQPVADQQALTAPAPVKDTPKPEEKAPEPAPNRRELDQVVDQMNKTLQVYNYNLKFEIVDKHRIVISVINSATGEVLKQIPPEDLVKAFKQMDEFLGVLVDRKV